MFVDAYFAATQDVVGDVNVFVNGVEVKRVLYADEDLGFVIRYAEDEKGELMRSADNNQLEREVLQGKVEIRCDREKLFAPDDLPDFIPFVTLDCRILQRKSKNY
jgi:hypothetical protein